MRRARLRTRYKPGVMNKLEQRYRDHLWAQQIDGAVVWFGFEKVTLKLVHDLRYTPDFCVLLPDGQLEMHEVKGAMKRKLKGGGTKLAAYCRGDAKPKIRVAADAFPMLRFLLVYPDPAGGWIREDFSAHLDCPD